MPGNISHYFMDAAEDGLTLAPCGAKRLASAGARRYNVNSIWFTNDGIISVGAICIRR